LQSAGACILHLLQALDNCSILHTSRQAIIRLAFLYLRLCQVAGGLAVAGGARQDSTIPLSVG